MGLMDSILDAGKNMLGGNANAADLLSKVQGSAGELLGAAGTETFLNGAKTAISGMNEGNKVELSQLFTTALSAMGKSSPEGTTGSPTDMILNAVKTFVANDPSFLSNILGSVSGMATGAASSESSGNIVANLMKSPIAVDFFKNALAGLVKH